jgi:hypothetical protein
VADWVAYLLIGGALAGAAWAAVLTVLDRPMRDPLFWLLAAVEVGLVAEVIGGGIALARTDRDVDAVTFVGYLAAVWLVLPVGVAWAASEKSRWGSGVLLVACLTVAVMVLRLQQLWAGA